MGTAIVEVEALTKRFADLTAVDAVTFQVKPGEVFGFLGPNGAGKSTTIQILCTLMRPTSGRARVAGFDVVQEADRVRQNLGIVFQDPTLDNRLTGRENLEIHGTIYHMPRVQQQERIAELLALVELQEVADRLVRSYSGGMKRRLEIIRGLLHSPPLLFLDEPTIGLDPQSRNSIWAYIRRLKAETGTTIFMTTHYMEEADQYCDRVAIIDHGRIVALDTPALLKAGIRSDLVLMETSDDTRAAAYLQEQFGLPVRVIDGHVEVVVPRAETFLPRLMASPLPVEMRTLSFRRPTLEDVFLQLTGHALRDEEDTGRGGLKEWARRRGG